MCPPKHEEWLVYFGTCCCCPWANSSFRFLSAVNSVDVCDSRQITCKPTDFTWHPTEVVTDISHEPFKNLDELKRSFMELVTISDFRTVTVQRSDRLLRLKTKTKLNSNSQINPDPSKITTG